MPVKVVLFDGSCIVMTVKEMLERDDIMYCIGLVYPED